MGVNEINETKKIIVLISNRGRQFEKVVLPSFNRFCPDGKVSAKNFLFGLNLEQQSSHEN